MMDTLARYWDVTEAFVQSRFRMAQEVAPWLEPHLAASIAALLGLVSLVVVARLLVGRRRLPEGMVPLEDLTRIPRRAGYLISALLVLGLGTWAFLAPLAGAAVAPGVISPDGNRRTVQHLEGGIVRAIHVKEGQTVEAGDLLLTLEDVEARARLDEIGKRYVHLLARSARLEAELRGLDRLDMPRADPALDPDELHAAVLSQRELLERRIATRHGREDILAKRIEQLEEENAGLRAVIEGLGEQARLINEEIASVTELLDKGLERRPRLLALERAAVDILIERASSEAQIARNKQKIGETEIQLLTLRQQDVEEASEELAEVRRTMAELDSEMPWRADVVARTEIRAPVSGKVFDVRVTTLSGVVQGGEPILDIVPSEVPLVIDARVKTNDIDVVEVGMSAQILLSAYQQRNMPKLMGTLRTISADRVVDERRREEYFLAKIEVPREALADLPDVELVSGMPAEVMILTGESTVADYVIGPLLGSVRKSFRENHGS